LALGTFCGIGEIAATIHRCTFSQQELIQVPEEARQYGALFW
jgi:hypothetical protein